MNVWKVVNDYESFDKFTLENYDDWDILLNIDFEGESLRDTWIPIKAM